MPTTDTDSAITERAQAIAAEEQEKLLASTPKSKALYERALRTLPYGVASTFQAGDPYPLYLEKGAGSQVWDVDGTPRVDYHNGFGCMVVGHAHPKVVEAIERAARTGTHFAATTEITVAFAEELCRRFEMEQVRFANSGTEATMDAIRIARAATGRDDIIKIEGSYHGHHDWVMFSVVPNADAVGGLEHAPTLPMSKGIPADVAKHVRVVPFNDADALATMLDEHGATTACLIMEPVMMNIGLVEPEPGYLAKAKELCAKHGVVLIFDEVKAGATVAPGGAADRYGVRPDLACYAKAICGGTPGAAFGGRADIMDTITHGAAQQGTFNGNPLVCAAGLAALTEVMTPDAYAYLDKLGTRLAEGIQSAFDQYDIPAHTVDLGCKGAVSFRAEKLRNYRDFLDTNDALFEASFPWIVNRGVFMTPGNEEQWTISVQHSEADIDRYVNGFGELCAKLAA